MKTRTFKDLSDFARYVPLILKEKLDSVPRTVTVGIPGGRGAESIVTGALSLSDEDLSRLSFYLVDERLSGLTNEQTLLDYGFKKAFEENRMRSGQLVILEEGRSFMERNQTLDLLFLGVGEDGHIASLFPGSFVPSHQKDVIVVTDSPKMPKERISISYDALRQYTVDSEVYLLFFGEGKQDAYNRFVKNEETCRTLPVQFCRSLDSTLTVATDLA
ncbi:MAG: 6-phosphogluconolactonase [Sphaerochaetaceae bacterium]